MCAQSCLTLCDPVDCKSQAPLSVGFFRQEYWRGLPFPPPEDVYDPVIEPTSPSSSALQAHSLSTETSEKSPRYTAKDTHITYKTGRDSQTSQNELQFAWLFSHQVVPTLLDPTDRSAPGSPSLTMSCSLPKFMSIPSVMPSNHLLLWHLYLFLPSTFPSTGSFPMSQLFASGGQSIGASGSG